MNETECAEKNEGYDNARFALVVYIGTPVAFLGTVFNGILLIIFCHKKSLNSPDFYLLFLAIFDMLICVLYIPFFTMDALAIYYQIKSLHHLWHTYVMQIYCMSRFVQFGAVYMMLCATFERFVYISSKRCLSWFITDNGRLITAIVALVISLIFRFPTFFDYKIVYRANCPPFQDYLFLPMLMSYPLYTKFNFYMMSIVQTILPFILLTCFNIVIIYLTHKRLYKTSHSMKFYMLGFTNVIRQESKNRKIHQELKYATRTMVAIVFTYLTCNVFSVFMSVLENVFPESSMLVDNYGSSTKFYTMAADLVSILVVLNSLLRMTVHMICNPQFRERFKLLLIKFSSCWIPVAISNQARDNNS
uniref:G_PROTEIN_RECEP_F1_2 domain-containing protein n=1 Tax=Wuchereria bancrofti TaxID=6293 RepID=A0AAF5PUK2_WUCBA